MTMSTERRTSRVMGALESVVNVRNRGGGHDPPSPRRQSGAYVRSKSVIQLSVDEASDRTDAGSVGLSVVAILVRQGLVTSQASDGVLDDDTRGGKRGVVDDVFGRPRFLARLATRREPPAGRVERHHSDIGQVAQRTDVGIQPVEQPRGL